MVHRVEVSDGGVSKQYALKDIKLHVDKLHDELHGVLLIKKMQLKHENLVQFYEVWFKVDEVRIYILMEYCENGSLRQYTDECRELPAEKQIARWCLQIAEGTHVSSLILIRITAIRSAFIYRRKA